MVTVPVIGQFTSSTPIAFSGLHITSAKNFKYITQSGKFSMVDVYLELSKAQIIKGFDRGDCRFLDGGKPESIVLAESLFE